ncbi:MAG: hypothetical protein B7Z30_13760, partial [Rhizobiales bacterium 12-68-15]
MRAGCAQAAPPVSGVGTMNRFSDVELAGLPYRIVDLPAVAGPRLARLPWLHRVLLENLLR